MTMIIRGAVSPTEARVQFGARLHRVAEGNEPVVVERGGDKRAVAVSLDEYELLRLEPLNGDEPSLQMEALDIAARFTLPAVFNGHYLALAGRLGIEFWTADRRLFNAVHHWLPSVNIINPRRHCSAG